ncbi:cytochrome c oxidase subunit 3, partial [Mesorhizobium sp. M00.F.Ca.ET.149.01.1.1]
MADAHAKPQHDYHLVNPSPWPFLGSVGALITAIGGVCLMQYLKGGNFPIFGHNVANPWLFFIGLIIVLYTMFAWWSDTIKEAHEGYHTRVVSLHLR